MSKLQDALDNAVPYITAIEFSLDDNRPRNAAVLIVEAAELMSSGSIKICTCLMGEGVGFMQSKNKMILHNSWCDGLTEHRWVLVPKEMQE